MKKILASFILTALAPITTFAISLSDLTNNPDQYTKVHQNDYTTVYVDNESIKVVKDESPDYTIRGIVFLCDNKKQTIAEFDETTDFHVSYEEDKHDPNTIRKLIGITPKHASQNNAWTFSGENLTERITKFDMKYIYGRDLGLASLYWFKKYFDDSIEIPD